jgi:hypothetical protein
MIWHGNGVAVGLRRLDLDVHVIYLVFHYNRHFYVNVLGLSCLDRLVCSRSLGKS